MCEQCADHNAIGVMTQPHPRPFESAIQQNPKRASMGTVVGPFSIGANPAVNSIIINQMELSQFARSLVFINTSGSTLQIDNMKGWPIPPALNYVVRAQAAARSLQVSVAVASATAGQLWVLHTEEELPPTIQFPITASIGASVAISAPIGQTTMAGSVSVAIASNQSPVPVTVGSLAVTSTVQPVGATNHNGGVVALAGVSVGALGSRPTRVGGFIRARKTNTGTATVDGVVLQPGDILNLTGVGTYTCTANTSGDSLDTYEEWN